MNRIAIYALGVFCILAQAEEPSWQADMDRFSKEKQVIDVLLKQELDQLDQTYLSALKGVMEKAVSDGDLGLVIAIKAEEARIKGEPINPVAEVEASPIIDGGRERLEKQRLAIKEKALVKIETRLSTIRLKMKKLEVELTKKGQVKEAVAARAAMSKLEAEAKGEAKGEAIAEPAVAGLPGGPVMPLVPADPSAPAIPSVPAQPLDATQEDWLIQSFGRDLLFYLSGDRIPKAGGFFDEGPARVPCQVHGSPKMTPGKRGNALYLPEAGDYIDVQPFALGNEITMAAWVYLEKWQPYAHFLKMSDGRAKGEVSLHTGGMMGSLRCCIDGRKMKDWSLIRAWQGRTQAKVWMHLAMTFDAKGLVTVYMDGQIVNQRGSKMVLDPAPRKFARVGRDIREDGTVATNGVYGMIDELVVLRRALSHAEIVELFAWSGGR